MKFFSIKNTCDAKYRPAVLLLVHTRGTYSYFNDARYIGVLFCGPNSRDVLHCRALYERVPVSTARAIVLR